MRKLPYALKISCPQIPFWQIEKLERLKPIVYQAHKVFFCFFVRDGFHVIELMRRASDPVSRFSRNYQVTESQVERWTESYSIRHLRAHLFPPI